MRAILFWLTNRRPERWRECADRPSGSEGPLVVTWLHQDTHEPPGET
jgi:hypothetical protein